MLKIQNTKNGNRLTVAPQGRLDTVTAPKLEKRLANELKGVDELILDLGGLEYISSAGLRVLLSAQKRMAAQGGMKVRNVSDALAEIFEITGFSDILTVE